MRFPRRRWPTAQVVRVQLERPLEDLEGIEHDEVLLIARLGRAVVGQAWLPAASARRAEDQWAALARTVGSDAAAVALRAALAERLAAHEPPLGGEPLSVSVVVCTRDRPEQLADCLRALLALEPPAAEIIVVDNASRSGATRHVCEALGVRCVREPLPGASRARNRGIAESRGALLAFTDDDCLPEPRWLDGLEQAFADPLVQAVTGYVGPWELSTAAQRHFERHGGFQRHATPRGFEAARMSPALAASAAGASANMVVRRSVFDEVGPFAEDLGPGTPARAAEDKELLYRIFAAGYRVRYDPARVVWHRHRHEAAELRRVMNDYAVGEFAWMTRVLLDHRDPATLRLCRWWLRHFAADARRWARRRPAAVPLAVTGQEVRGALAGALALRSAQRSRRDIPALRPPEARQARPQLAVTSAEPPSLSVAVASRNRRDSLRETLRALAAQDYPADRWEVVLALDGGDDGSAAMARALDLPFALRVLEQPHRGLAAARNLGAEAARHPIVVFLDDDIRPVPEFLAAHAAAHAEAPADHLALGHYPPATRAADFNALAVRRWWTDHFRLLSAPGHRWRFTDICDGNASMPVRAWRAVGRFDEEFSAGRRRQDWEFGVRVLSRGVPVRFHRRAVGWHFFDPSVETALRNTHQEARDDVLLATKHPAAAASLPLARLADRRLDRLVAADALVPRLTGTKAWRRAAVKALDALEAANLRGRWFRLMGRLMALSYAAGVVDALPDPAARARVLDSTRWTRQGLEIDLDGRPTPLEPDGVVMPRICVRHRGRRIAAVDAVEPGGQWDTEALLDRLVAAVGAQGALPYVMPPVADEHDGPVASAPR